jgi:hypothetical protein
MSIGRVFISHSSKDKAFVDRLVSDLVSHSIPVWFDKLDLPVGASVPGSINEGIAQSRYFLIVLSPAAIESTWVREELNASLMKQVSLGGTFILPVLLQDCAVPPLLAHRRYADFRSDYIEGLQTLLEVWGKDSNACTSVGCAEVVPWPVPDQPGQDFVYLYSERFDKFFRVACSLTWTADRMLKYLITSRSLPYGLEQSDLGMRWSFSYGLVLDKTTISLSTTLEAAGVTLGSVLRLHINATYEDIFVKELNGMWGGPTRYNTTMRMIREEELRAAIASRGNLTKERLRELSNKCFSHV